MSSPSASRPWRERWSSSTSAPATRASRTRRDGRRRAGRRLRLLRLQVQRAAIDAVAHPACVAGAVVEDVAQVAAAARADDLRADHAVRAVLAQLDRLGDSRLGEARPARAALELRVGAEQLGAAAGALEHAVVLGEGVLAGERRLGRLAAQHGVLLRRQLLAPLRVCLLDLLHGLLVRSWDTHVTTAAMSTLRGCRYCPSSSPP